MYDFFWTILEMISTEIQWLKYFSFQKSFFQVSLGKGKNVCCLSSIDRTRLKLNMTTILWLKIFILFLGLSSHLDCWCLICKKFSTNYKCEMHTCMCIVLSTSLSSSYWYILLSWYDLLFLLFQIHNLNHIFIDL